MATTTGSLATTGSVTHGKAPGEATAVVQLSGTYGTVTLVIEASVDGTNFFAVAAVAESSGAVVTGTLSPTDNSTVAYRVPADGMAAVRARATAVGSGTLAVAIAAGDFRGQPFISLNNSGSLAMTALTATVGASTAAAGTTVSNAGALPAGTGTLYPTTGADGTKGVVLSASDQVTGRTLFIGNGVSNAVLKVYGPSGAVINGAAADAAFSGASGKGVIISCLSGSGNTWLAW